MHWPELFSTNDTTTYFSAFHIACMYTNLGQGVRLLLELQADPNYANSKGEDALTIATKFGSFQGVNELLLHGVHPLLHTPRSLSMGRCTKRTLPSGRVKYALDPDDIADLPTTVGTAVSIAFSMPILSDANHDQREQEHEERDDILHRFMWECDHTNSDELTLGHAGIEHRLQSLDPTVQDDTLIFDALRRGLRFTARFIAANSHVRIRIIMDPNKGLDMFGNGPLMYALSYHGEETCRNLVRSGADMLKLAVPPRPLPDPMPVLTGHMATISRGCTAPIDIMLAKRGHPHYPRALDDEDRMLLYDVVRDLRDTFQDAIMGMWRWQANAHVRQEVLSPAQIIASYMERELCIDADQCAYMKLWVEECMYSNGLRPNDQLHTKIVNTITRLQGADEENLQAHAEFVRQSIYRGKSFDGWHALPRDVVRIIIRFMLPPLFHPAALEARLRRFDELHRLHMDRMAREAAPFELD